MNIEELDFELPEESIAQQPCVPRDACKLMHLPSLGEPRDALFSDLPELLEPGDTLVFNDSKVLPARVDALRESGGSLEVLFLNKKEQRREDGGECWEALLRPSRRVRSGEDILVGDGSRLRVCEGLGEGRWVVSSIGALSELQIMERWGKLPLPPYIKEYPREPARYQTVYAAVAGSAAAPTAGLHFTKDLMHRLEQHGVRSARVTLHIGLDTFLPIREPRLEDHRIHSETYHVSGEALETVGSARAEGRRLIAVGTTSVRVLETLAAQKLLTPAGEKDACRKKGISGSTDIFITPGYDFVAVDAMITNLHLPRSTVLAMTMAFGGSERIKRAYSLALQRGYRFFSFGDAMLVEPPECRSGGEEGHV